MGVFKFLKGAGQRYVDLQKRNLRVLGDVVGLDGKPGYQGTGTAKKPAAKAGPDPVPTPEEQAAVIREEATNLGLGGDFRFIVEGERVRVEGDVPDQETLEKIVLTAGNIEGISEVDATAVTTVNAGETSVFYTVKKGDTLSKIAKAYLGNAMKYPQIFEANTPMLTHPDKIYPGQVLRIPGGKEPAPKA